MEGEITNLTLVSSAAMASLFYCHSISAKLPKGKWRLISLLPIFFIFTILPLYTTSAFFTTVTALFITWLANFKLLLFAFDLGPIGSGPPKSLPIFIATAAFPFKIKPENRSPNKTPKKIPLINLATEIPASLIMMSILFECRDLFNTHALLALYCCLIFLGIEISVGLCDLLVRAFFGLDLEPASDEPYLSTSIRDFWGRRWNHTVNSILRETVYKPVRSAVGGDWAAVAAVVAAFLVSGLMHELIFWYVIRGRPSWEMTAFFVVQGVGVVVEFGLEVGLSEKKLGVPWWLRAVVAVGFVVATSFWLFFPPLVRNGVDVRVIEEFRFVGGVLKEEVVGIWLFIGRRLG